MCSAASTGIPGLMHGSIVISELIYIRAPQRVVIVFQIKKGSIYATGSDRGLGRMVTRPWSETGGAIVGLDGSFLAIRLLVDDVFVVSSRGCKGSPRGRRFRDRTGRLTLPPRGSTLSRGGPFSCAVRLTPNSILMCKAGHGGIRIRRRPRIGVEMAFGGSA